MFHNVGTNNEPKEAKCLVPVNYSIKYKPCLQPDSFCWQCRWSGGSGIQQSAVAFNAVCCGASHVQWKVDGDTFSLYDTCLLRMDLFPKAVRIFTRTEDQIEDQQTVIPLLAAPMANVSSFADLRSNFTRIADCDYNLQWTLKLNTFPATWR